MSQQGPLLIVASAGRPSFATALEEARMFPLIDTDFADALHAIEHVQPAAVLVDAPGADRMRLAALAEQIAARKLYLPVIAVEPDGPLPDSALPFTPHGGNFDRLPARLRAALRVRALHATVQRRLDDPSLSALDPVQDATLLLIGRGGAYPALSVALGERMGVVGAFSIEAAAKHLNSRDIDGILLGEGFSLRVMDAFLTVLSEDARFRHLPIILTSYELAPTYELPNLEIIRGEPSLIAANALPLIRQHALAVQLSRTLRAIETNGLIDPQTGLLTPSAFDRDFATAVNHALSDGVALSVARFVFDPQNPRAQLDGARIISKLMRKTDFGAVQRDGTVLVVFADVDQRAAHGIARRLSAVMRHTTHGRRGARTEPTVTIAALMPKDTAQSLLARLRSDAERAAS
jgi:GGDEF domain-containing protein